MANVLTNILPKILVARGLMALREQAVAARLVSMDYGDEARQKGTTIDIPIAPPMVATAVTPSHLPPEPASIEPGLVQLPLDQWYKVNFHLTDKERGEVEKSNHALPGASSEGIRALANIVHNQILSRYTGVYGYVGTAGTAPFATAIDDAVHIRRVLNEQLCPLSDRSVLFDPTAEANALKLAQMSDWDKTSDPQVRIEGLLGRKLGFAWIMSQLIPYHTAGTAVTIVTDAAASAGATSVTLDASSSGTLVKGDIISFAGHTQTYVVTSTVTVSTSTSVSIQPALKVNVGGSVVVTKRASHRVNLAMHRQAFTFASRPMESDLMGGSILESAVDDVSGIALRLEITRQYKQAAWEFDILWGSQLIRPQFATRLAG